MSFNSGFGYHYPYPTASGDTYNEEFTSGIANAHDAGQTAHAFTQGFWQPNVEVPLPASHTNHQGTSSFAAGSSPTHEGSKRKAEPTTVEQPPAKRRELNTPVTAATPASSANGGPTSSEEPLHLPAPSVNNESRSQRTSPEKGRQGGEPNALNSRQVVGTPVGAEKLPAATVFPIQVGSELFKLSGASLSSDAPSYFSHHFTEQLLKVEDARKAGNLNAEISTLYIDRDPKLFRDIYHHLQGYHLMPRDAEHWAELFADAHYYALPRLKKHLFTTDIFVHVGGIPFRIPRDLFQRPGDRANFFTIMGGCLATSVNPFPGLNRNALLRPPPMEAFSVPTRSGELFAELLNMLRGQRVEIRNETHRENLLAEARHYKLNDLEQRLVPCTIAWNQFIRRSEIQIHIDHVHKSGLKVTETPLLSDRRLGSIGVVCYARPWIDDSKWHKSLLLEISGAESIALSATQPCDLEIQDDIIRSEVLIPVCPSQIQHQIHTIYESLVEKAGVKCKNIVATTTYLRISRSTYISLNGGAVDMGGSVSAATTGEAVYTHEGQPVPSPQSWIITFGLFRVGFTRIGREGQPTLILDAVRLEAVSDEKGLNGLKGSVKAWQP